MAQYTIEDIEIIRQKSGISYEEAVNLLEYHNGSLARALVDLEKNGRLKDAKQASSTSQKRGKNVLTQLYRMRIKVYKGEVSILNLSVLFVIFSLLAAFWVPMIGFILSLFLGYRITFDRNCKDFSGDTFDTIVKNASSNVKNTMYSVARDIGKEAGTKEPQRDKEEVRTESPASGTTPVNVQFPGEGKVDIQEGSDGFHEVNIQ